MLNSVFIIFIINKEIIIIFLLFNHIVNSIHTLFFNSASAPIWLSVRKTNINKTGIMKYF